MEATRNLSIITVTEADGRLLGALPLFSESTRLGGRTLRLIGSGEVCSDYVGVLAEPGREQAVADALAEALAGACRGERSWDQIELCGIDAADCATRLLAHALAERGHAVDCLPAPHCWRIPLPPTWDEYLARLSKNRRRQVRRMERTWIATGRARLHTADCADGLAAAMERLVELHGRRRHGLGQSGAFDSPRFAAFHRQMIRTLFAADRLHLHWLEVDGRAVAAEYDIAGGDVMYAYQSGIDPQAMEIEPGSLLNVCVLRRAIESGYRHYDYLRGDEPYKAHWRAEPRAGMHIRIAARTWPARWRRCAWRALRQFKGCLRPEAGLSAPPASSEDDR